VNGNAAPGTSNEVASTSATEITIPLAVLALTMSYRSHRRVLPQTLGVVALGIAYFHVVAGTPEWTMALVIAISHLAAAANWWVATPMPPRWCPQLDHAVRQV
jgi:hypothetical protein